MGGRSTVQIKGNYIMSAEIHHEDFIGVYDGFFTEKYCNKLINYFEWCLKQNKTWKRPDNETHKNDLSCVLNPVPMDELTYTHANSAGLMNDFNTIFWDECYKDYLDTYSVLKTHDQHTIYTYKIQKTMPGQGYHIWHCENGEKMHNNRLGVYTLYLNDIKEGGETEFLYCSRRVEAKTGRLVIFPANYPWTHRGNPPLKQTKYIMTGWIEFC
jgi:hypothetical protein